MCADQQQDGESGCGGDRRSLGSGLIARRHPIAARILRRWRELTGGRGVRDGERRAVVGCSGGVDSVALAAVLALLEPRPVIVHVEHDVREDGSAQMDRDLVEGLAKRLGCGFVCERVAVRGLGGNLEHHAREARYRVLSRVARAHGIRFVVTGHHGDDQLETVLMHLLRGSGVRGLGGMAEKRSLGEGLELVRPMLGVSREEIEGLCAEHGLNWREDPTNADEGYLRNRLRAQVLPMLKGIEPAVVERVAGSARSCRRAGELIEAVVRDGAVRAASKEDGAWSWGRDALRGEPEAVLGELMFVFVRDELGSVGADSMTRRAVEDAVGAIKSDGTDPRVHRVGPMVVEVRAGEVKFLSAGPGEAGGGRR